MAQIKITANIDKRDLLKQFNQHISNKFEARFFDLIIWRIAFMLSLKSGINETELKKRYESSGIGHQNISQDVSTIADDETKYIFINLLSLVHNKKIDTKEEFPELLKLHCRHGFDILESEISDIGVNDNIIDFFINQLENPKDININNNNNEDADISVINKFKKAILEIKAPLKFIEEKVFDRVKKLYFDIEDINYVPNLFSPQFVAKLEVATALRDKLYIQQTKRERVISINIVKDNQPIYISSYQGEMNNNDLSLIIGMDDEDNIEKTNLKDLVHLLVAGTTGSGKTVFLHSLIYQFLKKDIELYLIDGKSGFEFGQYEHNQNTNIVIDNDEIVPTIKKIIEEMEERFSLNNIKQSKPIIVIVDEFVDLIMQKKLIEDLFVRLAQKGRGAKIHLVLATQRPDSNILKGVLRSNIPSRVAFKVQKSTESKIILDETGAENLFGKGDMLFYDGKEIKRLQGFLSE
ncbi:MAG: DndE family protein [Methanosarcinales archaeon]|nr:DndE family protein [Methanosarcinales archaeon]